MGVSEWEILCCVLLCSIVWLNVLFCRFDVVSSFRSSFARARFVYCDVCLCLVLFVFVFEVNWVICVCVVLCCFLVLVRCVLLILCTMLGMFNWWWVWKMSKVLCMSIFCCFLWDRWLWVRCMLCWYLVKSLNIVVCVWSWLDRLNGTVIDSLLIFWRRREILNCWENWVCWRVWDLSLNMLRCSMRVIMG